MKKITLIVMTLLAGNASAAEDMRLAGRMLFKEPELAKPGACVMYREGGAGWIITEPVYWLKGRTVAAQVQKRRIEVCPDAGKQPGQLSREEFNRLARTQPCVSSPEKVREEDIGVIRLRIDDWETPWAKKAANSGRLYQGYFLDQILRKGEEMEIDADLLMACP